jgi:mRNA interferase MazF
VVGQGEYVPRRGDVVWIELNPQAGHEQAGRRPAVILSPESYNGRVGLALLCPITSLVKGYPFEVLLPSGMDVSGVVLSDQVKCLDWRSRRARFIFRIPSDTADEILRKLGALLKPDPR